MIVPQFPLLCEVEDRAIFKKLDFQNSSLVSLTREHYQSICKQYSRRLHTAVDIPTYVRTAHEGLHNILKGKKLKITFSKHLKHLKTITTKLCRCE